MKAIEEANWMPVDDLTLESAALDVVKAPLGNALVVAGPGAGKTELLAQRACFLLQTNLCKFPHRILAISFKRDAAFNLKDRVTLRAGSELSMRFDSLTYDSFAKQLLDRFHSALPNEYQIPTDYEIVFEQDIIDIYNVEDRKFVSTNSTQGILTAFTETALPLIENTPTQNLKVRVWKSALKRGRLTFKMVMRLAEFILNSNPKIREYLQETYDYIFLDEFQDTTSIQYEFLASSFAMSGKVFTAVGDDKQRIMLWAGAKRTVFEDFLADYQAERIPLRMNFRSAPLLVNVQNSLISTLLNKQDFATPSTKWRGDEGECLVWEFRSHHEETKQLVTAISNWINKDQINPRDVCILVKGSLGKYVNDIIEKLNQSSINARDESTFQEFLTDDVILYIINSLYLVLGSPKVDSKKIVFEFLSRVNNEMSDQQLIKLENKLSAFVKQTRQPIKGKTPSAAELSETIKKIVDFANVDRIRSIFPIYRQSAYLKKILGDFEKELQNYFTSGITIQEALDKFCGEDTIPVMTVHKSKGLEYHTVVFVGLEDGAFWSFSSQPDEDKSTFFVALSRAKMRVVFTFSQTRDALKFPKQTREKISIIFQELKKAGVKTIAY